MLSWIKRKWAVLKARLKGWRTVWANVLAAIPPPLLLALQYAEVVDVSPVLSPEWAFVYGLAVNVLNIWLRSITTGPIGSKV